jgi:hypothetical protein
MMAKSDSCPGKNCLSGENQIRIGETDPAGAILPSKGTAPDIRFRVAYNGQITAGWAENLLLGPEERLEHPASIRSEGTEAFRPD